ncbi:TPA: SDR family NAD(P)-dependent oxidoreductase, partial [Staphylococcus aureus]|nr:SDR family NAD(P)-dependent oxidoreductase [Staphylococcus aureus]
LASMYHAGARGLLDQESNDFKQLVNDQPQTLQSFLQENI